MEQSEILLLVTLQVLTIVKIQSISNVQALAIRSTSGCNGNGIFNETTNRCECLEHYTGETCSACSVRYFHYPQCYSCLTQCEQNNGTCGGDTDNRCICSDSRRFTGLFCTECQPNFHGPNCVDESQLLTVRPRWINSVDLINGVSLIITGIHLNVTSPDGVICHFQSVIDWSIYATKVNETHISCWLSVIPKPVMFIAAIKVTISLDNGTSWLQAGLNCHDQCSLVVQVLNRITSAVPFLAASTEIMNEFMTSDRISILPAIDIIENYYIQVSLTLAPILENISTTESANQLREIFTMAFNMSSRQISINVSYPNVRLITNAIAIVKLFGTSTRNASILLQELRKQIADPMSLFRQHNLTATLNESSILGTSEYFVCSNGFIQTSVCSSGCSRTIFLVSTLLVCLIAFSITRINQ